MSSLDRMVERAGVALGKAAVDQIAQTDAQGEHGGGGQDEGEGAPMTWPRWVVSGEPTQLTRLRLPSPWPRACQERAPSSIDHSLCGDACGDERYPRRAP